MVGSFLMGKREVRYLCYFPLSMIFYSTCFFINGKTQKHYTKEIVLFVGILTFPLFLTCPSIQRRSPKYTILLSSVSQNKTKNKQELGKMNYLMRSINGLTTLRKRENYKTSLTVSQILSTFKSSAKLPN